MRGVPKGCARDFDVDACVGEILQHSFHVVVMHGSLLRCVDEVESAPSRSFWVRVGCLSMSCMRIAWTCHVLDVCALDACVFVFGLHGLLEHVMYL